MKIKKLVGENDNIDLAYAVRYDFIALLKNETTLKNYLIENITCPKWYTDRANLGLSKNIDCIKKEILQELYNSNNKVDKSNIAL